MQGNELTRWEDRTEVLKFEGRTEMLKREGTPELLTSLRVEGEKAERMT